MTEQQIPVLVAELVRHQRQFGVLSVAEAEWVRKNPKEAIEFFCDGVKKKSRQNLAAVVAESAAAPRPEASSVFARGLSWMACVKEVVTAYSLDSHSFEKEPRGGRPKLSLSATFKKEFFGALVMPREFRAVHGRYIEKETGDQAIVDELGYPKRVVAMDLAAFCSLVAVQDYGYCFVSSRDHGKGLHLHDGCEIIFYLENKEHALRSVRVRRLDNEWYVSAYAISDSPRCGVDSQVASFLKV